MALSPKKYVDLFRKETRLMKPEEKLTFLMCYFLNVLYFLCTLMGLLMTHFKWEFAALIGMGCIKMLLDKIFPKSDLIGWIRFDSLVCCGILSYIIYLKYFV